MSFRNTITRRTALRPLIPVLVMLAVLAACPTSGGDDDSVNTTTPVTATPVAVTGVSLDATAAAVNIGTSRQLTATVAPSGAANKAVTWSSSAPSVAAVSSSGLVTSAALGTTTVTVTTADGGKSASCAVTVREPDVYVGGSYDDGICHPGYWKNGVWTNLTPASPGYRAEVQAICFQNGILYAAGYCYDSVGGYDKPGYWKNGTWNPLPTAADGRYGYATSITVSGSDVYAAGTVQHPTGSYKLAALWKNGVLTTYDLGTDTVTVNDLAVSGTDVYIAGYGYDGTYYTAGYWKNGTWNELAPLVAGYDAAAHAIAANGTTVAVAGYSYYGAATSTPKAVKWTNGVASTLDTEALFESQSNDMSESGGSYYTAGFFNKEADSPDLGSIPCYWKDGELTLLSKPDVSGLRNGSLSSGAWIAVSGSIVYVAGAIRDEDNGGSNPYVWRNGVRTQLETQSGYVHHNMWGIVLD